MSAEESGNLVQAMNTQLEENAEFRGSKENQEDLLLTAQRYLNIFHQIHIFKAFKRAQFNKELIEMPEKIRKIVAMLPGGRVLLEYIEEIEKDEGIQDSSISALIEQQGKGGSSVESDNSYTLRSNAAPAVINAPIEISSDFTNLLKETFNTYSQNLQQLSANIQKIAAQRTVTAADGTVQVMPDITETISTLLKENSKQQTEVLKSFGQTLSQSLKESKSELSDSGITDTIASLLKENAQQQNEVLKSLGATLSQTIVDSKGEPSVGVTNSIAALLKENAQQQNEVLKSLGETLSNTLSKSQNSDSDIAETIASLLRENAQQQNEVLKSLASTLSQNISAPKAQSSDSDIAETVSSLLKENARQQTEVLKSFGETLSQAILQSQKELVASLLRNQSPTLVQVQAQAYASPLPQYKTEAPVVPQETKVELPESSDILPLPVNTVAKEPTPQPKEVVLQPEEIEPQAEEVISQPEEVAPQVQAEKQIEKDISLPEETPEKGNIFKAMGAKLSETKNKLSQTLSKAGESPKAKDKDIAEEKVEPQIAAKETTTVVEKTPEQPASGKSKKHKKKSGEKSAQQTQNKEVDNKSENNEISESVVLPLPDDDVSDIKTPETDAVADVTDFNFDDTNSDISATIFNTSNDDTELSAKDISADDDSIDIDFDDFFAAAESAQSSDTDVAQETTAAPDDFGSAFAKTESETKAKTENDLGNPQTYDNAMLKIRDALSASESISLDEISEKPVSLSPDDDTYSADDSLAQAFSNFADTAQVISSDEADAGTWQKSETSAQSSADEEEWEYVDENGNPISADGDEEWEYVDENGNPVSADGDEEWEYVDENGNPISPDGDEEWEYVDENGNPISPDDDGEWEYVDENGNVVNH